MRTEHIHVSRIEPHPGNIRGDLGDLAELADSIRAHGVLQPLIVTPHPEIPGRYQLLAGHRRLAAAKLARADRLPCMVRGDPGKGDAPAIEVMLVENCQRAALGPAEKAEAMGRLRDDHGYTAADISRRTGLTSSAVSYYLSLLELDAASLAFVRDGQVKAAEAVTAVRTVRAADRRRAGKPPRRVSVARPYFGASHPLALEASAACRAAGHTAKKLPGAVACGPCWEEIIRGDEHAVIRPASSAAAAGGGVIFVSP